jgi:hypothetical protein
METEPLWAVVSLYDVFPSILSPAQPPSVIGPLFAALVFKVPVVLDSESLSSVAEVEPLPLYDQSRPPEPSGEPEAVHESPHVLLLEAVEPSELLEVVSLDPSDETLEWSVDVSDHVSEEALEEPALLAVEESLNPSALPLCEPLVAVQSPPDDNSKSTSTEPVVPVEALWEDVSAEKAPLLEVEVELSL